MYFKNIIQIHYWPGIICAWFLTSIITSEVLKHNNNTCALRYTVAVFDGNVYAFFPYISDTGALPPESCIFGQMLNIGAVLMAIGIYFRYRYVEMSINENLISLNTWWNTMACTTGNTACFGVSIVGNFQETTVGLVHLIGGLLAFVIGSLYLIIQTRISFEFTKLLEKFPAHGISPSLFYFRVFLSCWLLPLIITYLVCGYESLKYFTGKSFVYWNEQNGGFELHIAATFAEWILTLLMFIYIATFTVEFKSIRFNKIDIELLQTMKKHSFSNSDEEKS